MQSARWVSLRRTGLAIVAMAALGLLRNDDRLLPLAAQPGWNARASLSPDGRLLVFNDAANGSLKVFDLQGKLTREIKRPGLGSTDFNLPLYLTPWDSGFLLLDSTRLLWFDAQVNPEAGWILPLRTEPPNALEVVSDRGGTVSEVAVWEAWALGPRTVVAFGDFLDSKGWRTGVGRLQPLGDGRLRLDLLAGDEVKDGSPSPYYLFPLNLHPNMAVRGKEVFQLRFGLTATLEQILPKPLTIQLPKPFDAPLPALGALGGRDNQPLLFARLRAVPVPISIHVWKGSLWLATSRPGPKGDLRFEIWRWNEKGGWNGPQVLAAPPEGRELALAPGPDRIALLFKSAILHPEEQLVLGFRWLKPDPSLGGNR